MHLPCIYRVFGKEYDEDDPEHTRQIGQVSNNSVKCPLCNQKTRLRNVVRLYLQAEGDIHEEDEGDPGGAFDPDEIIVIEGGSNGDVASYETKVRAALEDKKARIKELNTMLTSTRRRCQLEVKERLRLEQENGNLAAELGRLEGESKRRLDAMRGERDGALRERKIFEKKAANLHVDVERLKKELEEERAYSSRQVVALDESLTGDRLRRKLRDCPDTKDWFHDTLETRNRKIMKLMNDTENLEKEVVQLKKTVDTLERENRCLSHSMERQLGVEKEVDDLAVLSQIQNVPAPKRKHSGVRGSAWPGSPSTSSKAFLHSGASRDGFDEADDARRIRSRQGRHSHQSGSGEKHKASTEDIVVLLDDDDDDDVIGEFAATATAAAAVAPGSSRWKPASASFAMAGPSRETIQTAPGPSFIKSTARASTGLDNPGTYIKRYPDGRGGWTQNGRKISSSGGARKIKKDADISDFFRR